ncbi:MAG: hypothetical protein V7637_5147 [Mycobacteriales bacterium]
MGAALDPDSNPQTTCSSPPEASEREARLRRWVVLAQLGTVVLAAGGAVWLYLGRPSGLPSLTRFEFDPSPAAAAGQIGEHATGVWWYAGCWVLGALALGVLCYLGGRILVTPLWIGLARRLVTGTIAAAALMLAEGLLLAGYPRSWWPGSVWVVRAVQAMAFTRNSLLAIALPLCLGVLVTTAIRLGRSLPRADPHRWAPGEVVPGRRGGPPPGRTFGGKGICVSGGGIRSACVALGALQVLQREGELSDADYLVSVSGGGYTAGAYQMALTDQLPTEGDAGATTAGPRPELTRTAATAADVLAPGSPEEGHLRRHSSYVADSAMEWAAALGTLLRGVSANLGLLAATVAAGGGLVYLFYRFTHIVTTTDLAPIYAVGDGSRPAPHVPVTQQGVATALVAAAVLTVLAFSVGLAFFAKGGAAERVVRVGRVLASLTVVLAFFGLVLPLLLWATGRVTWSLGLQDRAGLRSAGLGTILLTYLSAIVGILWRSRKAVGGIRSRLGGSAAPGGRGVAGGLVQRIVVGLALLMLAAVFLLQLGWTATTAPRWSPWAWVSLVVVLAFFAIVLDQTWLSLHPFYRRRLASAFAVRRVRDGDTVTDKPYSYEQEVTRLSRYGGKRDRFPQVIFAGTANLSGSASTPPGRRAVSYTMSHDWIGGPQVGWLRTSTVDGTRFGHVSRDITVQAAVAVSGAAFASAMGSQARAYQTFFALSNARLGTWLPNPGHVAAHLTSASLKDWTMPRLPTMRRLQYLLREIVGAYPEDNPLLFITDGGHYENLGLVELLRHRCRVVYCIDASGDSPPLAAALAQAIMLADEELGATITLHDPFHLVAGGGEPLSPAGPLSTLSGRLAAKPVITGDIAYPARDGHPASTGTLVVAKACLTGDMPYELLSYAQSNPVFPRDATADQWFNVGQFDAYQAVGRHIGAVAVDTMRERLHGEPPTVPPARSPGGAADPPRNGGLPALGVIARVLSVRLAGAVTNRFVRLAGPGHDKGM